MTEDLANIASNGKVKVLRTGEESARPGGRFYAPATISLIHMLEETYNLVDAGCFGEEGLFQNLLQKQNLREDQIGYVFITHNHPDHIGTISLYKNAYVFMPDSIFSTASPNNFELMQRDFMLKPGNEQRTINREIALISTPGHSGWDMSVLHTGKDARILTCGDLFWNQKDWERNSEFMSLCVNPEMQKRSRDYVRETLKPEVVIPGHGRAFQPKY